MPRAKPLTSEEKTLLSALDPVLESAARISIDERGNETRTRTEYAGGTARLTLTERPGCDTPARSLSIDGFTIEQTDAAGVTTRAARRYTANATVTDALGNTARCRYDVRGRKVAEWGSAIQSPRGLGGGLSVYPRKGRDAVRRCRVKAHALCARSNAQSRIAPQSRGESSRRL